MFALCGMAACPAPSDDALSTDRSSKESESVAPGTCWQSGREPWYAVVAYFILDLYFALFNRAWPLSIASYALFAIPLELAFYCHARRFQHVRSNAPNCMFMGGEDSCEARRCWERVLSEDSPAAIEKGLQSWFIGKGELGTDDVATIMSVFIYNCRLESLPGPQREIVNSMVKMVEVVLGRRLPAGRNPSLRCLATYVFDGLAPCNKPLLYYLYMQTLEGIIWWVYRRMGLELRCTTSSPAGVQNLEYWYRPPAESFERPKRLPPPPVVILHGVGGLLPYCVFVLHVAWCTRGAVIVPLFPQCALSQMPAVALANRPPVPRELAAAVREMLAACGARKAAFIAHSFGTAVLATLLKKSPQTAVACTLVDPICFQLHTSAIVANFLLAEPPLSLKTWVHYAQKQGATRELTLQDAFRRRFWYRHPCLVTDACYSLALTCGSVPPLPYPALAL